MKIILLLSMIVCSTICKAQSIAVDTVRFSLEDIRCAVAHGTKDGWFDCDFKGTYYPYHIFDTSITKWFIKMKDGDSLFYYRHFYTEVYIWNGRPKNEEYGYFFGENGNGITIPDKYNGSDTLRIIKQVWEPKNTQKNESAIYYCNDCL